MSDHYKTLGLSRKATKQEIKEAFRKCALKFHPDRHTQSSKSTKENASLKFKQASEAYETLINDIKRSDYDFKSKYGSRGGGYASSSSSHSYNYNYSNHNYNGYGGRTGYYKPTSSNGRRVAVDLGFMFHYVTRRSFLLNVALVSALLGGAVIVEKSVQTLWNVNNAGKSFEETIQSVEKSRSQRDS